jgi:hypothetical protein
MASKGPSSWLLTSGISRSERPKAVQRRFRITEQDIIGDSTGKAGHPGSDAPLIGLCPLAVPHCRCRTPVPVVR